MQLEEGHVVTAAGRIATLEDTPVGIAFSYAHAEAATPPFELTPIPDNQELGILLYPKLIKCESCPKCGAPLKEK